MMQFLWYWVFFLIPLPFFMMFLPVRKQKAGGVLRVPFYQDIVSLSGNTVVESGRFNRRFFFFFIIWLFLLMSAARPQWLGDPVNLPVTGRDLMMAVDISGSMELPDLELNGEPVTRLDVVKSVAGDFIQRRVGDRLGLVLFGKRAYIQTPLTFDRKTVKAMLDEAEIGLAGKETAIGDAIGLAVKRLREKDIKDRILILLTDGANTAGMVDPRQAARLAADEGLKIYTLGIGAETMDAGNLPGSSSINPFALFGNRVVNPSRDLDEDLLKYIAQQTGGIFFRARSTQALQDIYRRLDVLEPTVKDEKTFRPVTELYFWFLSTGFLLGLLYLVFAYIRPPSLLASRADKSADTLAVSLLATFVAAFVATLGRRNK